MSDDNPQILLDEQPIIALLQDHLGGMPPIKVEVEPMFAFALIGTIQLALRHPLNTGPTSELMRTFKDDLIDRLANGDENVSQLLRRGDDPAFDFSFAPEAD